MVSVTGTVPDTGVNWNSFTIQGRNGGDRDDGDREADGGSEEVKNKSVSFIQDGSGKEGQRKEKKGNSVPE